MPRGQGGAVHEHRLQEERDARHQHDDQHRHPEGVQRLGRADEHAAQEEDAQHDARADRAPGEPGEGHEEEEKQDGAAGGRLPSRSEVQEDLVDEHRPQRDMEPGDREQVQDAGPLERGVRVRPDVRLVPHQHAFEHTGFLRRQPLFDAAGQGLPECRESDAQRPPGEPDRRDRHVAPGLGLIQRVGVDPPAAGRPEVQAPGLVVPGHRRVLLAEGFQLQRAAEHIAHPGLIGV